MLRLKSNSDSKASALNYCAVVGLSITFLEPTFSITLKINNNDIHVLLREQGRMIERGLVLSNVQTK